MGSSLVSPFVETGIWNVVSMVYVPISREGRMKEASLGFQPKSDAKGSRPDVTSNLFTSLADRQQEFIASDSTFE